MLTQDAQGPEVSNVCREYQTLSLTVKDPSGVTKIEDENGRVLDTFTGETTPVSTRVSIAKDVSSVYVYDSFGNITVVELQDFPVVDNIQITEHGTILVETDGVTEIYYYTSKGRKIVLDANPSGVSEISLPEGVTKFYMTDENGNQIEKSIDDAQQISKAVIKGTEAILDIDADKTVDEVVCYSSTGRVLGTIPANQIGQDGKLNVPQGTASVRVVYDDGSTNKVELQQYQAVDENVNAYQSDGDSITINLENSAGIQEIVYEQGGQTVHVPVGGGTNVQVNIPSDATNIKVIDGFGGDGTSITIPQSMPSVTDIQKDDEGNIKLTTNQQLYYVNERGIEQALDIDESGNATVPGGVDEVYTKDGNEIGITIDVSTVPTTVAKATLSQDGTKLALDIDTTKTLSQIVCYDSNGDPIQNGTLEASGSNINNVVNVPTGTASI